MSNRKKKFALVVGRFQPFHKGHRFLIEKAVSENDIVAICIGSARESDPLTLEERKKVLDEYLKKTNISGKSVAIVHVKDVKTDEMWVKNLKKECDMTDKTDNKFYSADTDLPKPYLDELGKQGIKAEIIERITFDYEAPDGKIHKVSSATQIRELLAKFGVLRKKQ